MKYLVKNEKEARVLLGLLDTAGDYRWYSGNEPLEYKIPRGFPLILDTADNRIGYEDVYVFGEKTSAIEISDLENIIGIKTVDGVNYNISYGNRMGITTTDSKYSELAEKVLLPRSIKLPKDICDILDINNIKYASTPFSMIKDLLQLREDYPTLREYCLHNVENQEKLLDALRYGWSRLPEQLYYIKILSGENNNLYIKKDIYSEEIEVTEERVELGYITKFTMNEIKEIDERFVPFAIKVKD